MTIAASTSPNNLLSPDGYEPCTDRYWSLSRFKRVLRGLERPLATPVDRSAQLSSIQQPTDANSGIFPYRRLRMRRHMPFGVKK